MEHGASFGAWLAERRRALRLSRVELARRVSCATVTLRKIEEDARRPSPELAAALAEQLGIPAPDQRTFIRVARGELRVERLPILRPGDTRPSAGLPAAGVRVQRAPLRTNLPAPLTSFVGRSQELETLPALLATQRLVTLTGVGGVGKTRLATEVGIQLVRSGLPDIAPDGVWMVELAPLAQPALVAQAIATALRLPEEEGRPMLELLQEHLADKQLLLILDNCEHLVEVCAELAEQLLQRCWQLRILATSREPLHVPGERAYPLQPLTVPGAGDEQPMKILATSAAQLFVARMEAGAVPLDGTRAAALAQICRQLDGIPLAIELAAPLSHSMGLAEIASQLRNQMAALTTAYRTAIPRHQTMHNALLWSHRLLVPAEQQVLACVAVFAGGWTLEAAQAVCDDGLSEQLAGHVHQLVSKSLVLEEKQGGQRRYRLLEPVRQFAQGQLAASGMEATVCQRHARYFQAVAEQAADGIGGPERGQWMLRLDVDHPNLRAALAWSLETPDGTAVGLCIASALCGFWLARGHAREGLACATALLARATTTVPTALRARALVAAGDLTRNGGHHRDARQLYQEALMLSQAIDERRIAAAALIGLGVMAEHGVGITETIRLVTQALDLFRATGDGPGAAYALVTLADHTRELGDARLALGFYEESLACYRALGDIQNTLYALDDLAVALEILGNDARAAIVRRESMILCDSLDSPQDRAIVLAGRGLTDMAIGAYRRAAAELDESISLFRRSGNLVGLAGALTKRGLVAQGQGDLVDALAWLEEGTDLCRQVGASYDLAETLLALGEALIAANEIDRATDVFRESLPLSESLGVIYLVSRAMRGLGCAAIAQHRTGEARALLDESLRLAESGQWLCESGATRTSLGDLAMSEGAPEAAAESYRVSLAFWWKLRRRPGIVLCLEGLAGVAEARRQIERAVRLRGAVAAIRDEMGAVQGPALTHEQEQWAVAAPPRPDATDTAVAWAAGHALTLDQVVAYAMEV